MPADVKLRGRASVTPGPALPFFCQHNANVGFVFFFVLFVLYSLSVSLPSSVLCPPFSFHLPSPSFSVMSTLFDDNEEPLLNFDDMDNEDNEVFRSCGPSAAFSATASTRSLGTPSSLLSQPSGLAVEVIARLTHDELTQNPEFMKYVDMVSHLQELLNLRRNPSTTANCEYPRFFFFFLSLLFPFLYIYISYNH